MHLLFFESSLLSLKPLPLSSYPLLYIFLLLITVIKVIQKGLCVRWMCVRGEAEQRGNYIASVSLVSSWGSAVTFPHSLPSHV